MADKKISELPLLNSVSGSTVIVPIVHDSTTVKVNLSQLAHYASQWSAKTGSANTFSGTQTFSGNVNVNGRLTVHEVYANYQTSSVSFSSGSNKFGDELVDKHEFTGSINATGSFYYNGVLLGNIDANTIYKLQQATASIQFSTQSLNVQTGSQGLVNLQISSTTGSINTTTASFDSVFLRISSTTGSINTTTASFDNVFLGISSVTGAINTQTSSQNSINNTISIVTSSFNAFTSSVIGQIVTIATFSGSVNFTTQSLNTQTGSQDLVNRGISSVTGSINTTTASFDSVFLGISSVTGAMNTQSSSQDLVNRGISSVTGSINTTTSSFDSVFLRISSTTGSINTTTSSFDTVFIGIGSYTSSNESWKNEIRNEINGIETYTASLKAVGIVSSSTQIQNYDVFALNSNLYNATGSINAVIGNIEAYTASLKAAAIVSSSTQVQNYNLFALTASANTFYGNQTFNNDVRANKFVFTDGVVNTNVGGQNIIGTSGNILYLYTGTSGLYINNQANNANNVTISDAGVVQTRGALTVGSPGNDQNIYFGGSNSTLDWASTGAKIQYSVGALQFSSVGTTNNMILQQQAGALFNAGITGSLMATNNVVSSSAQIVNYNLFALTASANTFWGTQTFSGSLNLSGSMQQTGLSTLIGNTVLSGSIAMSGSTTQVGNNTIVGNTVMSGSIEVSGSSNFKNSEFRVTGSTFFTGSHTITGNSIFSGSINIASGSSYYRAGNKLFNYGQWGSVQTQSGSANTALSIKLETKFDGSEGVSIVNNGSGFPTRITAENTGLYNIQFSLQLNTTATETCDFSVWFAMTGSNIANSNTDFSIDKTAGGGNGVAALNLLTPITAGDYVELYWSNNTGNGQLLHRAPQSTPTRPATPSAIVTITQVA